jgi:hypothetical protein
MNKYNKLHNNCLLNPHSFKMKENPHQAIHHRQIVKAIEQLPNRIPPTIILIAIITRTIKEEERMRSEQQLTIEKLVRTDQFD